MSGGGLNILSGQTADGLHGEIRNRKKSNQNTTMLHCIFDLTADYLAITLCSFVQTEDLEYF
jgi:hypothetical protein